MSNKKLIKACKKGSEKKMNRAIVKGADAWDDALQTICKKGHTQLLEALIFHAKKDWNWVLISVCAFGKVDAKKIISFVVQHGANAWDQSLVALTDSPQCEKTLDVWMKVSGWDLRKIFDFGCLEGNLRVIRLVEKYSPGFIRRNADFGLAIGCEKKSESVCKLMEEFGAKSCSRCVGVGLYGACRKGAKNLVQKLISHGACDWNEGLHGACKGGNTAIVQMMVERGATD